MHDRSQNRPPRPDDTVLLSHDTATLVRRVAVVILICSLAALVWLLAEILLLIFGAVLLAVVLRAFATRLSRLLGVGDGVALMLAGLLVAGVLITAGVLFGTTIGAQMQALSAQLSAGSKALAERLQIASFADFMKGDPASSIGVIVSRVFAWSSTVLGALSALLLLVFGGVYMAVDPELYRRGLLMLVPAHARGPIEETLEDAHTALRRWLAAQLVAMVLVGGMVGVGLALLGVPSAAALGIIAGVAEFVPIIGPVIAAVPILLVASAQEGSTLLWALALVVVVQQIESNVVTPLLVGRSVAIAPAVALFAIVSIGVLFGPLGVLFGFPLAIVVDVAVRRLYVAGILDERVEIAGEVVHGDNEVGDAEGRVG